jgi:DNA-binding MarR family transcriptional regulator
MNSRKMGLSPKEMSVLTSIRDAGRTRKEVARDVGAPPPELTRLLKSLTSKGLVTARKRGISSTVSFSDLKHATLLRRTLNEFRHMKLERILSLASLDLLSSLAASPGSNRDALTSSAGVSPRTLQTTLKRLMELGVVRKRSRGVYEISSRFDLIADFARELDEYSNQRIAMEFSPDAQIVWQRGREFIVRTKREEEDADFRLTAFSLFEDYGAPLFVDQHYYYHPIGGWRRTVDEVLLQSLLIRPRTARENTAILMLWERNSLGRDIDRLRSGAKRYGLENELSAIVAYFEDPERNRRPGFPRIDELREKLQGGSR